VALGRLDFGLVFVARYPSSPQIRMTATHSIPMGMDCPGREPEEFVQPDTPSEAMD